MLVYENMATNKDGMFIMQVFDIRHNAAQHSVEFVQAQTQLLPYCFGRSYSSITQDALGLRVVSIILRKKPEGLECFLLSTSSRLAISRFFGAPYAMGSGGCIGRVT